MNADCPASSRKKRSAKKTGDYLWELLLYYVVPTTYKYLIPLGITNISVTKHGKTLLTFFLITKYYCTIRTLRKLLDIAIN